MKIACANSTVSNRSKGQGHGGNVSPFTTIQTVKSYYLKRYMVGSFDLVCVFIIDKYRHT